MTTSSAAPTANEGALKIDICFLCKKWGGKRLVRASRDGLNFMLHPRCVELIRSGRRALP